MDIDVEDYEYAVVQGNDWERYRPKIIVVECLTDAFSEIRDIYRDPTIALLVERGGSRGGEGVSRDVSCRWKTIGVCVRVTMDECFGEAA